MKKLYHGAWLLWRMGCVQGILYSIKILFSRKTTISVSVKGISHPFLLRKKTSDKGTFKQVFIDREYHFPNIGFVPETIIDAGANIGLATIYFANKYPNAKIFSIEPENSNLLLLKQNISPYSNITLYPKALYSISGKELYINNANKIRKDAFRTEEVSYSKQESSAQNVQTISITDILKENNLSYIDLLKIDIECAEIDLFSSHTEEWLPRVKCLVIEIHDWLKPGCSKSVFSAIIKHDFSMYLQGEEGLLFVNNQPVK